MNIDLARLRACLLTSADALAPVREEGAEGAGGTPAAVLVPIVRHPEGDTLLLTRRTAHLRDHPGQISFPGGRVEVCDRSAIDTALRETEEEIGLSRAHIDVQGFLPTYLTGTGFAVTPVVATVTPPFALALDDFEVAEVFEVPLAFLLDLSRHERHQLEVRGALRSYYAMPYGEYFIWGATAGMIHVLAERFSVSLPE